MLWKWQKGRQENCEYQKFTLYYFKVWKFGFDAYILKYHSNTQLPWHTDVVNGGEHWRLNIKLNGNSVFIYKDLNDNKHYFLNKRFILFRPDLYPHKLNVLKNKCFKLSFGFVKFK